MTTAIHITDADLDGADSAADEFFRRITDAKKPSEIEGDDEGNTDEEAEEAEDDDSAEGPESDADGNEGSDEADERDSESEDEDNGEDDSDDDDEEGEASRTVIDSEDAVVKIKVDGEETEVSIKDLKRLYGQEASLTRKSMEAAEIRKRAEEVGARHVAGLEGLLERARAQAAPYAELNFLALAKDPTISQEEIAALSQAAQKAFDNVRFLEGELDGVIRHSNETRHQALIAQARETNKLLSDPKTGIEGWGEPLYNEIRQFAIETGLPQGVVDEIVDPVGIKLLHMAMKYAKGKKAVETPTKGPKKVTKSPKRIMKGASSETVSTHKTTKKDESFKRLQRSGSTDDAAEAFMARWSQ